MCWTQIWLRSNFTMQYNVLEKNVEAGGQHLLPKSKTDER